MKDPAFLFYSSDFVTGTQFFSDEQKGKYISLLCAQHLHGHLSEEQMIIICKSHDISVWKKFVKDADGLYYNERLEIEVLKRKAYSLSRSNNKTGKVKSENQQITKPKNKKNISKSYDNHMGNININKDISINKDIKEKKVVKNLIERAEDFKIDAEIYLDEYGVELVNKFIRYWTEASAGAKKLRWEKEPVFDIKKRLDNFRDNSAKWQQGDKFVSGKVSPSKKSAADERHNDIINSYDDGNED